MESIICNFVGNLLLFASDI